MTKEEIFAIVEEEDVEFIRLQFTDIFGTLKNIAITASQLEDAMENRILFDGSSVKGFAPIEDSDLYLHPDLSTFCIFPWRPQQGKVARFICNIHRTDGSVFEADPRAVLLDAYDKARKLGLNIFIEAECEFFLLNTDDKGEVSLNVKEKASYFDIGPLDMSENIRRDIVLTLEEMGIKIKSSHHEIAKAQHEIDFTDQDALKCADAIQTFRMAVKTLAKRHGLSASFMPKLFENENGSGMHFKISAFDDNGKNIFEDNAKLSDRAKSTIAGILHHARELSLINNPLVNSYKRLKPNFDAPVYVSWSSNSNRSALLRIPTERNNQIKLELRSPDSATNPYLCIAMLIYSILDGLENSMELEDAINENMYSGKNYNIKKLPDTLSEAIDEFESSNFVKEKLGTQIFNEYIEAKKIEWNEFNNAITDWEIKKYLERF
ncbi:type I glutamate--ammonia ligase [Lachnoanaerobaculum sp. JCM 36186]|jgi:glutamine synthetase, type I|uniref:type I glutamate--ammonia ligase n=1 Tax=Lachnoanaerobaculum TaxID=1164882 RepID=UPI00027A48BB|nr:MULTISPECIES: type I glutamate--ammonia ligase [unclassified Lachnoanaerobaculum]EJP19410.1 glutamine synthetase, type I [Lachnoanaerobaculum sp. ICM7]GMO02936.1 type I glutamate--ammonia ligase [Lachnoanaerobaculum sp. JCM 36186]